MKGSVGLVVQTLPLAASAWKPRFFARQEPQQIQPSCPTQYTVEYEPQPTVFGQPVEVITSITTNTTITPLPYNVPITVNNAPTLLSTIVTAYSTITNTLTRRFVTLTQTQSNVGAVLTTQTLPNPNSLDPNAITTILVLVPGQPLPPFRRLTRFGRFIANDWKSIFN
ncbi:hypothetical protein HBI45_070130 [Parastagonospora nodorum]|nr:hypothetical protein HBI45_070130 [Parastagonospora nodorum]